MMIVKWLQAWLIGTVVVIEDIEVPVMQVQNYDEHECLYLMAMMVCGGDDVDGKLLSTVVILDTIPLYM